MKENWSMLSINREISARHRAIFNLLEANFLSFIPKFNCLSWGSTIDWYWIRWIIDHKSLVIALSFLAWLPFHTHTRSQRMNSLLSYCIRESRALSIVYMRYPPTSRSWNILFWNSHIQFWFNHCFFYWRLCYMRKSDSINYFSLGTTPGSKEPDS